MKMQGSAFYFGDECDASDGKFDVFFEYVQGLDKELRWPPHYGQDQAAKAYSHKRTFYLQKLEDIWCGVVLSAKTTEFSHHVKTVGDTITVVARTVGEDPPVEVNFFCIRKDNNKGLYSHYMSSYPFGLMLKELWSVYQRFVINQKEAALDRTTAKANIKLEYNMRGKANYGPVYNEADFNVLMLALDEVSEFRVTRWEADSPDDEPMLGAIKSVRKSYKFKDNTSPTPGLIGWLSAMREKCTKHEIGKKPKFSGSVLGKLPNGVDKTVFFDANIDDHLDFDYDEIGTFDVNKLDENPCLASMIKVVRDKTPFKV